MNDAESLLKLIDLYSKSTKKLQYSEKYDNLICPVCNEHLHVLKKHESYYTTEYPLVCSYCTSFVVLEYNESYSLRLITVEEIAELSDDIRNNLIYMRKKYKEIQNV